MQSPNRFIRIMQETILSAALVLLAVAALHSCVEAASADTSAAPASAPAALTPAPSERAAEQAAEEAAYFDLWENDPYGAAEAAVVCEP